MNVISYQLSPSSSWLPGSGPSLYRTNHIQRGREWLFIHFELLNASNRTHLSHQSANVSEHLQRPTTYITRDISVEAVDPAVSMPTSTATAATSVSTVSAPASAISKPGNRQTASPVPPLNRASRTSLTWVVLNNGDLITTTQQVLGILQLGSAPDPDGGFRLGQNTLGNGFPGQQYTKQTGTLAINGVSSRFEEQIHIHLCNNSNSGVHKILDQQHRDNFRVSSSVDLSSLGKPNAEMMC
ncbi:hypothetical protein NUU61_006007 [Penicillium alfredii]|uniref:Uncharacterized protein n=1 Tax=Penicillium alfredii TaxID=1506179 RepID=A0A9W9F062_9EURO|nr:uncharacterized protein NUU61_006007 [Penicillium alfredii]KAJ5091137.1 hypothetical protein NUU61_006007 [Penicillium alfredii]